MKAKKSSKNLRMDLGDFKVTDDLKNNTELGENLNFLPKDMFPKVKI